MIKPKRYTLALLSCDYFELSSGKKYDENGMIARRNATVNFLNNKEYIKKEILRQAFDLYIERLKVDFEELVLEIEAANEKK
jgi:hypothetical protein